MSLSVHEHPDAPAPMPKAREGEDLRGGARAREERAELDADHHAAAYGRLPAGVADLSQPRLVTGAAAPDDDRAQRPRVGGGGRERRGVAPVRSHGQRLTRAIVAMRAAARPRRMLGEVERPVVRRADADQTAARITARRLLALGEV